MRLPDDDQLVIRRAVEKVRSFRPGRRRGRANDRPSDQVDDRPNDRPNDRNADRVATEKRVSASRSRGPIYIGGLDRSGKTTLAAFLTSHSNIAVPGVGSNMWTYFYGRFGDIAKPANFERCFDAMLSYKHVLHLEPDPDRIRQAFLEGPRTYARLFACFLDD